MQPLSYTCTIEKKSGRRNVFVKKIMFCHIHYISKLCFWKNIQSFITECYKYNYQKQKI